MKRFKIEERMNVLNKNMFSDEEEEIDDIEFVDDMLREDVIPKVVEKIRYTSSAMATLNVLSLIIALAMLVVGIIAVIKIGWLVGLFMIFCSMLVPMIILLISQVSDLSLNNHMFLTVMHNDIRSLSDDFYGDFEIVDIKRNIVTRNEQCPCGSGKKYKKCCGS